MGREAMLISASRYRKDFFFAKKKQKTFEYGCGLSG
jgi:hypothetical protein